MAHEDSDAVRPGIVRPPQCCIVFTTDQTYLFPTLVSAMQAREHSAPAKADVLICHFDVDARAEAVFAPICAREGIGFMAVATDGIEGANPMMSRLFLDRFIPEQYRRVLYMDGDVHVTGSLDPLIEADIPEGRFLAANDPMTFLLDDGGALARDLSAHLASIGLSREEAGRYFNTGILCINRTGWNALGLRAWDLTHRGARTYRFPDQDPLNIVAAQAHIPMALRWNFPIFMRHARVCEEIAPRITHFMSSPKPWHGAYPPWQAKDCLPYARALERDPSLAPYRQTLSPRRQLHYRLLQTYKKATETLSWGYSERRNRILRYERQARLSGP